jgi:hypothetical protein
MLKLKRFDEMDEVEYQDVFNEIKEAVVVWRKDFTTEKFRTATTNLRKQLIDAGMSKGEAQRLIWEASV